MDASARQTDPRDVSSVGASARSGSKEALAALGRLGGKRRAAREKARKAEAAREVVLGTVQEMREFLQRRAGEVETSDEAASVKANAAARLVTALTTMDGYAELVRENVSLRAENVALRTQGGGGPTVYDTSLSTLAPTPESDPEGGITGLQPVAIDTETAVFPEDSR